MHVFTQVSNPDMENRYGNMFKVNAKYDIAKVPKKSNVSYITDQKAERGSFTHRN